MTELEMTESEMIAKVARRLLVLENSEDLYLCDYLTDCVLKLHDSLKTIMPVLKCSGVIAIIDLNLLTNGLKELHSVLVSTFLPDEIYTVSESSCVYARLECCLSHLFKICQLMDVSDWDANNPCNSVMRTAAMECVSSLLDCTKILQDVLIGRLASCPDIRSYYSRRRVELKRILSVFEDGVE